MRIRFVLGELWAGLRRNVPMATAVVLVTFVSLTFVGAAALLQTQIGKMQDDWYDRVEVSIFLCPSQSTVPTCTDGEVSAEQLTQIREVLESDALADYVEEVYFESKEEAYEALLRQAGDQDWVQRLEPEFMQASFRVKLVDPTQFGVVADEVRGRPGVEVVQDQREILEPLFTVLNRATAMSIGLAAVMTFTAILLITTTIRLSAMSRRRETEIMRFVGASNFFIQLPFMLEGALAALLGAILATGALWAGVHYGVQGWLAEAIQWVRFVTVDDVWRVAPWLALAGIALAVISSLFSLSRYTKV